MTLLVTVVLVAVVVSVLVLLLAAAVSPEGQGPGAFVRDLRAGLAARFGRGEPEADDDDLEPVDTTLDDFFAAASTDQDAYFGADRLASRIEHVVEGARRGRAGSRPRP